MELLTTEEALSHSYRELGYTKLCSGKLFFAQWLWRRKKNIKLSQPIHRGPQRKDQTNRILSGIKKAEVRVQSFRGTVCQLGPQRSFPSQRLGTLGFPNHSLCVLSFCKDVLHIGDGARGEGVLHFQKLLSGYKDICDPGGFF